jgi:hypothetical protein
MSAFSFIQKFQLTETVLDTVEAIMDYSQHFRRPLTWFQSYLLYFKHQQNTRKTAEKMEHVPDIVVSDP